MLIAVIVATVAALVALLRGGSLESLAGTPFRWAALLFVGLVAQAGVELWDPSWLSPGGGLAVILITNALVAIFLLVNFRLPGLVAAGAGMVLNVLVIAANGAMPVSRDAVARAGGELSEMGVKHEIAGPGTLLPWLGDVIPVPGLGRVISAGDILLAAGIGWLVYRRTVAGRKRRVRNLEASG